MYTQKKNNGGGGGEEKIRKLLLFIDSIVFDNMDFSVWSCLQSGRKETVLDLAKFVDKGVQVKLTGGRQGTQNFSTLFYYLEAAYCLII